MNTTTFKKRAAEIYTQKGELSTRFKKALSYLESLAKGEKIYPYSWSRSRGLHTLVGENHADNLLHLCNVLGLTIQYGNSGRGGKEKEYFFLEKKDIAKLKQVDFSDLNQK